MDRRRPLEDGHRGWERARGILTKATASNYSCSGSCRTRACSLLSQLHGSGGHRICGRARGVLTKPAASNSSCRGSCRTRACSLLSQLHGSGGHRICGYARGVLTRATASKYNYRSRTRTCSLLSLLHGFRGQRSCGCALDYICCGRCILGIVSKIRHTLDRAHTEPTIEPSRVCESAPGICRKTVKSWALPTAAKARAQKVKNFISDAT